MDTDKNSLALFHPLIAQWFERLGRPTEIQAKAWPRIAAGEHCLITAPTGSGKTLTAFLWALNQFVTGKLASGNTRVLYVSPLKALNNDIFNNLTQPLSELHTLFTEAGQHFPRIRVQTRSGDTEAGERRRMLRQPPEILITTPESLNLLLSSKSGLTLLGNLDTVILDEVHSVLDNKRGAYLMSAVERLVDISLSKGAEGSGEFQRIALSATVKPLAVAADFIGGYQLNTEQPDYALNPQYHKRPVTIVEATTGADTSQQGKRYQIDICYPDAIANRASDKSAGSRFGHPKGARRVLAMDGQHHKPLWDALAEALLEKIKANRSTLIFVNNRALSEKLTHKINLAAGRTLAYAHHGSLSRDIRLAVEQQLKAGQLAAIVATSSLEMGIDIGALDEVCIIQTSGSLASAIQRVGRAGHKVGAVSKGVLYPTHPQDFIEAAVLANAIGERDIEPVKAINSPLDVLAQVIISMTGVAQWNVDQLFAHLKTSSTYHELRREQFDLVIDMLAGRYSTARDGGSAGHAGAVYLPEQRIRELKPRVVLDRLDNTLEARPGALLALYLSGGVIPDRGYFQLRHLESGARIGELDEEFVWEAKIGQHFTLGTQYWQIQKITHNDVFVTPGKPGATPPPFWKAETINRNFYFSERIGQFLEQADAQLQQGDLLRWLQEHYPITEQAARPLVEFLDRQRRHTGCDLPHRRHIVIENVSSLLGHSQGCQLVIHTGWGGAVNRPLALAMEAAWLQRHGEQLNIYASNECLVLQLPDAIEAQALVSLVSADRVEPLLRRRLEGSGFFGARFRECAGRALLLSKGKFNQRQPLWMSRLQSQKLLENVLKYEDFPILLETWRTCLRDEFDLEHLKQLLTELDTGEIRWSATDTKTPSPMAQNIAWEQVNQYMYMDDTPGSNKVSNLRDELLRDIVFTPELRPRFSRQVCAAFEQKRQRLAPGYAPDTGADLLEWIKERAAIPEPEWEALLSHIGTEVSPVEPLLADIHRKAVILTCGGARLIVALEKLPAIVAGFYPGRELQVSPLLPDGPLPERSTEEEEENADALLEALLGTWLSFYGPLTEQQIVQKLDLDSIRLRETLTDLAEARALVVGELLEGSDALVYCDRENVEILLYLAKREAQPTFEALPLRALPLFLSHWQSLAGKASATEEPVTEERILDRLFDIIRQQQCYFATAALWESEIFPARLAEYNPRQLDHIFQEADLHWMGREKEKAGFCFQGDLDLLSDEEETPERDDSELAHLFPDTFSRYDFNNLLQKTGWPAERLVPFLWNHVWRGELSNDTFAALRKGIENHFTYAFSHTAGTQGRRPGLPARSRRAAFSQWKQATPSAGNWYRIHYPEREEDRLASEERNKDRVRLLLERYGVVFRELLHKEIPAFRWGRIFRALRLMELSREVLAGYFFEDIPGPQFISREAFRTLQQALPENKVYWLNAADPVSLCGVALPGLKAGLPKRLESNHIVYCGMDVVLVSQKNGKQLTFHVPATDERIAEYLVVLRHLLYRAQNPLKNIRIESINGIKAQQSEYLGWLKIAFDVAEDYKYVTLYRRL